MTKYEILIGYTRARMRDSWLALGSNEITSTSRAYNKDQIYKVNYPATPLHGALLFCKEEYLGSDLPWNAATISSLAYGEITFTTGIISPNFSLLLTADELVGITEPPDSTFVPFLDEYQSTSEVQIDPQELDIILSDIGHPFITDDELEYSPQQIINNMIRPALEEYFKWFPKVEIVTYPVTSTNVTEHQFPTGAYDVVHVSIQQGIAQGTTSNILLRYFDEIVWSSTSPASGHIGGSRSPRTRTSDWGAMMMDRAVRQGMINYAARVHHTVVLRGGVKYLSCYTNKTGYLQVHYAMQDLNWGDIEFARRPEARRLATAYVMKGLAAIRSQSKANIPGAVDYTRWLEQAEKIREDVINEWKDLTKFSGIIRGNM